MTKRCSKCGEDKALSEFSPHRTGSQGRYSYCRPCAAAYAKARNEDPSVRAVKAAKQRERRSDPVKAQADRVTSARWKANNPERARVHNLTPEKIAYNAEWSRAHPESRRASAKKYQALNPEIRAVTQERRRARLLSAKGELTLAGWRQILADFNHRCGYCLQSDVPLQQEHMVPLSKGGRHDASNVIPACAPCNYRKHTRGLLQFLSMKGVA